MSLEPRTLLPPPAPPSANRLALRVVIGVFLFVALLVLLFRTPDPPPRPQRPQKTRASRPESPPEAPATPEVEAPTPAPPPRRAGPNEAEVELTPRTVLWHGHVRNAAGLAPGSVHVRGCGGATRVDEEGYYEFIGRPGPCELRAERSDGALTALGEPVSAPEGTATDVVVDLSVSPNAAAGMGIGFSASSAGMQVTYVHAEGGAFDASILPGDLIVEIDRESTLDMTADEFMEWGVGVEGTEVALVVVSGGKSRKVTIRRRQIRE